MASIRIIKGIKTYIMENRAPFKSFGNFFAGNQGWGESISPAALKLAIKERCEKIAVRYISGNLYGKFYWTDIENFIESDLIRTTEKDNQETICISFKLMERVL